MSKNFASNHLIKFFIASSFQFYTGLVNNFIKNFFAYQRPSPRLRRNVAAVASRWRRCVTDKLISFQQILAKNQIFIIGLLAELRQVLVTSGRNHRNGLVPELHRSDERPQRWRAVVNTASKTTPGFEPQTYRSDSNVLITELTGQSSLAMNRISEYKLIKKDFVSEKSYCLVIIGNNRLACCYCQVVKVFNYSASCTVYSYN